MQITTGYGQLHTKAATDQSDQQANSNRRGTMTCTLVMAVLDGSARYIDAQLVIEPPLQT